MAAFSASTVAGCAPLTVTFRDESTGNPTSWNWEFTGVGLSTLQNPSVTFSQPGTYSITLVVRNADGTNGITKTDYITVYPSPSVSFSADRTVACLPGDVQFTDASTYSAGTITSRLWNFGDGNTSTAINPSHTYTSNGFYTVSLTVGSSTGCSATAAIGRYIRVVSGIIPNFTYSANTPCTAPFTTNFINQSSGPGDLSYTWQFGDGNTDNTISTSHGYTAPGNYAVKLIASSDLGCVDSITKTITINSTNDQVQFTGPSTTCTNMPVSFINTSSAGANSFQWSFGDRGTSSDVNPSHTYTIPGTYTVSLTGNYSLCSSTITHTITVTGADFDFTATPVSACSAPLTVNFSTPSAIGGYQWDFGDGSPVDNTQSPSHTYTSTGIYTVTLTIPGSTGCSKAVVKNNLIQIQPPSITINPTTGCTGYVYTPIANGNVVASAADGIATYTWDWGDGTTGTGAGATHTYTSVGNYDVTLTITTNGGCTVSRTLAGAVHITNSGQPTADFTLNSDSVSICQLMEVKFNFAGSNYQSFYWDFGDGATSTLQNPTHFYNDYGNYTAKLYLTGNGGGCIDSAQHSIQVVQPNSSMISYPPPYTNCNNITVDFSITVPPTTSFVFNYGDGQSDNTQTTTLRHTYVNPNNYSPSLTLRDNSGCLVGVGGANTIQVIGAEPFYSQDRKTFCDNGPVTFTNFIIGNDPVTSYLWNFGDGITSSTDPNPVHNYTTPGVYQTSLTVNTQSGCAKTLTDTVRVYRTPAPAIISRDIICAGDTVSFGGALAVADTSITWNWTLGDGKAATTQNTSNIYNIAGTYTVNVQAANLPGCTGTATKNITVASPPVITKGPDPVIPVGTGVNLPVSYTGKINSYAWTPTGNLSCTDCAVPFANPKFTTSYKIVVTDLNGCTATDRITVNVICNEENYFIPNTFSPNNDGMNDIFYPRGKGLYTIRSMRVFNRWGELVYEKKDFSSNDPSAGWNGSYKGKPAGKDVYIYIAEVVCENAQIVVLKGNVTLVR